MKKNLKTSRQQFDELMTPLFETVEWIALNKKEFNSHDVFDYPTYGGMPHKISRQLSSEIVDRIQDNLDSIRSARSIKNIARYILPL